MTNDELGSVIVALLLLIVGANLLGQLFARLHQPKVVGEILAGVLLGPSLLGHSAPGTAASIFGASREDASWLVLGFMYHLGLLLLMFVSGSSVRHVLGRENRRPTAWLLGLGTPLPFLVALLAAPLLPIDKLTGEAGSESAVVLVFAAATAVTSIPVITKIFHDLGILHTRFASLMLGAAVLEDIALWGVLSVATAIASATLSADEGNLTNTISSHVAANAAYIAIAMLVAPSLLRRASRARWNTLAAQSPVAWIVVVMLGYVAVADALDVTLVFAAFLAGFGIVGGVSGSERERFRVPLDSINHVAGAVFIPVYFAIVGYRLDFTRSFDPLMLVAFLFGTSFVVLASVGFAARLAGFRGLDLLNLALTCNARGGPGIVLASAALDAGIINAPFFTTLVVTAVVTSQICGAWLDFVVRRRWPLLSGADLRRRGFDPEPDVVDVPWSVDPAAAESGAITPSPVALPDNAV
jgi:Kef-type K+ transport system membrane component KefB